MGELLVVTTNYVESVFVLNDSRAIKCSREGVLGCKKELEKKLHGLAHLKYLVCLKHNLRKDSTSITLLGPHHSNLNFLMVVQRVNLVSG